MTKSAAGTAHPWTMGTLPLGLTKNWTMSETPKGSFALEEPQGRPSLLTGLRADSGKADAAAPGFDLLPKFRQ